jgi:hypothetical protein
MRVVAENGFSFRDVEATDSICARTCCKGSWSCVHKVRWVRTSFSEWRSGRLPCRRARTFVSSLQVSKSMLQLSVDCCPAHWGIL